MIENCADAWNSDENGDQDAEDGLRREAEKREEKRLRVFKQHV